MPQSGVRSGLLLMVVGLFIVLRSTRRDAGGQTLVDHLLGIHHTPGVAPGITPAQAATLPPAPGAVKHPQPKKNAGPLSKQLIPTPAPYPT